MVMFSVDPWPWLFLPFIMFVRMALNAIDGMLAREHGMKSALGAMLNELTDVVSDIALYLPFVFVAGHFSWLVVLVCLFAVVSEMAGVVAVQIGSSRRYDGPMGKSDRAFVFGTIGLLVGLGFSSASWIGIVLACVLALLFVTTLNRVSKALKERAAHE